MARIITDFETWFMDESDRVYRYLVYKKVWTPLEMDKKYTDESEYENGGHYTLCHIEEAIEMSPGNWMLGLRDIYEDGCISKHISYYPLSDIRLSCFDDDQKLELFEEEDANYDE
jgi:hypothetical protein